MKRILVTGASGFIGQAICKTMLEHGINVRATGRNLAKLDRLNSYQIETQQISDISPNTNWKAALAGCDTVIHLAARTHIINETSRKSFEIYNKVNTEGTLNLARQAAGTVKRFIFLSTVKVNGEGQTTPYRIIDKPSPQGAYAISKYRAELGLHDIARETGLDVVILRPPLVYGPGVGANFKHLLRAVNNNWPLPLGGIKNKRSLLYVENLADAIITCIQHPQAPGNTYFLSDSEDISTPDLIRRIALSLNKHPRLWHVPNRLLNLAARLTGNNRSVNRLMNSLTVDISDTSRQLNWTPPFSLQYGLNVTTTWFKSINI